MKFKTILSATFFAIIVFLLACDTTPNPLSGPIPHDCLLHNNRPASHFEMMDPVCARALIATYDIRIGEVRSDYPNNHNIDSLLIRGVATTVKEIRDIIRVIDTIDSLASGGVKVDSIFMMLAADVSGRADMIFAFKPNKIAHPELLDFYNFTQPCPHACPWPDSLNIAHY